ncbi:MAG: hypothetical protein C0481_03695 [Phenylobacterium sp.]|nr:hypothetical protein [Phenylobacterium sp.]
MLVLFIALLVTIASIAQLAEFWIGKSGDDAIRMRLVDLYVSLDENWRASYQVPARATQEFLAVRLGLSPMTKILRIAAISILATFPFQLAVMVNYVTSEDSIWSVLSVALDLLPYSLMNVPGDILSWTAAIFFMRIVQRSGPFIASLTILASVAVAIGCAVLGLAIGLALVEISDRIGWPFWIATEELRLFDIAPELTFGYLATSIILPLLPLAMYSAALIFSLLVLLARRPVRGPLLWLLPRLEGSTRPVLTVVAVAFAALAGALAAWTRVF